MGGMTFISQAYMKGAYLLSYIDDIYTLTNSINIAAEGSFNRVPLNSNIIYQMVKNARV